MKSFKVICKATGKDWVYNNGSKINYKRTGFLGLFKKTVVEKDRPPAHGPAKEEICIVVDVRHDGFYSLAGYTKYGFYDPSCFIRLDEFSEGQKEIAEKTEPQLN